VAQGYALYRVLKLNKLSVVGWVADKCTPPWSYKCHGQVWHVIRWSAKHSTAVSLHRSSKYHWSMAPS